MTETWREPINRDGRLLNRWFLSHHQMDVCGLMSGLCPQISIDMPLLFCDPMLGLEGVVRNKRSALLLSMGNRKQRNSHEALRRYGGDRSVCFQVR
jgi:hypothetical protein